MQTFLPYESSIESAKVLDRQRLGKQRLEAIMIAKKLLGFYKDRIGYNNHPAVKMWKGFEAYLIKDYLYAILQEWESRGYRNIKCSEDYKMLYNLVKDIEPVKPNWLNEKICITHQSNLIRKNAEHYKKFWPDVKRDFPYYWPV